MIWVLMNGQRFAPMRSREQALGYIDMMLRCRKGGSQHVGDLSKLQDGEKAYCAKQKWTLEGAP